MPILIRAAFKPTASISMSQQSVNLERLKPVQIIVPGRHDPCIVPRGVPVVESMVACIIADHSIRAGLIPPIIKSKV
jgi:chorismate synthase